jgi:hypothetical protein
MKNRADPDAGRLLFLDLLSEGPEIEYPVDMLPPRAPQEIETRRQPAFPWGERHDTIVSDFQLVHSQAVPANLALIVNAHGAKPRPTKDTLNEEDAAMLFARKKLKCGIVLENGLLTLEIRCKIVSPTPRLLKETLVNVQ